MYEGDFRRRDDFRRTHRKNNNEKNESTFHLTEFQTVICVVAIVVAVIIRIADGGLYSSVKNGVAAAFNNGITQSDVASVFKTIKGYLPDANAIFASSKANSSSSNSSLKTSSSSSSASSGASSSKATSSVSSAVNSTSSVVKSTNTSGTGGTDIVANLTTDGKLITPSNVSLVPYKLSTKPILPVEGNITSAFGYRLNPITKKESFHTGIDIASPKSTPIKAALAGTVKEAGKSTAYGNYILLIHDNGILTFYGHCDKLLKKQGDKVKAGDIIALVGSTGISTGYHLHFEIRINNKYVNPQLALL
jgi:murein DD-endopeptidase MepM/ murein hydrolase activator NlpD